MIELGRSTNPLVQLMLVRHREFAREPESIFWVLIFPVLLAAGLGIAFRNDPTPILKVAATTQPLTDALRQEPMLDVRQLTAAQAHDALRVGTIVLMAEPWPDGGVTYRYDDTIADARTARMLADRAAQRAGGRTDVVAVKDMITAEPGSRYIDFLLPGLLGMNLMTSAIWGVGYNIVDTRRRKLMKRLIATPMPRSLYLLSFVLHMLMLMLVECCALLLFGIFVFQVPLRGSLVDLGLLCVLTTLTFSALGLLLAARVQTVEAASGLMNVVMMPMWIASGVFFSAQRFPDPMQPVIHYLPLTAAVDALRANMLQGATLGQAGPQLAILAVWTLASFALALRTFRWR